MNRCTFNFSPRLISLWLKTIKNIAIRFSMGIYFHSASLEIFSTKLQVIIKVETNMNTILL